MNNIFDAIKAFASGNKEKASLYIKEEISNECIKILKENRIKHGPFRGYYSDSSNEIELLTKRLNVKGINVDVKVYVGIKQDFAYKPSTFHDPEELEYFDDPLVTIRSIDEITINGETIYFDDADIFNGKEGTAEYVSRNLPQIANELVELSHDIYQHNDMSSKIYSLLNEEFFKELLVQLLESLRDSL